jgi:hypothetical protein
MVQVFFGMLVLSVLSGCIPERLKKYFADPVAPEPANALNVHQPHHKAPEAADQRRSTIFALSEDSFRLEISHEVVWSALINVLIKDYNLILVDQGLGLVTTEWDTFYQDEVLHRNKLSARLVRVGSGRSELSLHNNVEQSSSSVGGLWLPAENKEEEVQRIMKNLAISLNQAAPQFQVGNFARANP